MKLIRIMAIIAIILLISFLGPFLYFFLFFTIKEALPISLFDVAKLAEWHHILHLTQLILAATALLLTSYFTWRLVHPMLACVLLVIYGAELSLMLPEHPSLAPRFQDFHVILPEDQALTDDYPTYIFHPWSETITFLESLNEESITMTTHDGEPLTLPKGVVVKQPHWHLLYEDDFTWGDGKRGAVIRTREYDMLTELANDTSTLLVGSIFSTCGLLGIGILWKRRKRAQA